MKIAIIGAGAAGLTAAEELKNQGYQNITIFEKSAQAGGKCCSIEYQNRFYELGAGIITSSYFTILELAKKYKIELKPVDYFSRKTIDWDDIKEEPIPQKNPLLENIFLFYEVFFRYKKLIKKHKKITEPGLLNVNEALTIPFSKWADQNKTPHLAKLFSYFFTAFGYGYYDEIPTAYVLKYYSWPMVKSFLTKKVYYLPNGIQHLWTTIAKNHQVIYGTNITKIERDSEKSIKITFQNDKNSKAEKQLEFDKLIITSPLDETLKYLDSTTEEKNLFSKILYYDYRTYALILKGFPNKAGFFLKNFTSTRKGHPIFWNQQYQDSNLFAFYTIADKKTNDDQALKNIEKTIHKLGGKIETVQEIRHWKYFPHVDSAEMKNGYFNKLENLQDQNNTFYAGEIMNFSTVELTAEYAKKLVERFF